MPSPRGLALPLLVLSLVAAACGSDDSTSESTAVATTAVEGVIVSGMAEWEGRGQATIDGGDVSISGDGSPQGAGTASEPFTVEARIESC